jgi:hypothetical protein
MSREIADGGPLVSFSLGERGPLASYAHGGVYDRDIVCEACELRFKAADDYGIDFRRTVLGNLKPSWLWYLTVQLPTFQADPALLHLFALQCWYRSYLSDRPEHDQVADPHIAAEAQSALLSGASTLPTGRQVALHFNTSVLGNVIQAPVLHKLPDHPVYRLALPNMSILIAASDAGLGPAFKEISLRPGTEVTVWRTSQDVLTDREQVGRVYQANRERVDRLFEAAERKAEAQLLESTKAVVTKVVEPGVLPKEPELD